MQVKKKYAQDFTANERMSYIGGSDIAAVMDKSRWCTPLQLWSYKTGRVPAKDLSDNERVKFGKKLEWVVVEEYAERHNVKVQVRKEAYVHPKYPFLQAHVDRIIVNSDKILEAKTCGAEKGKEWKDSNIPVEYILQANWNAGLSKRKYVDVAVLIGGNHYEEVPLEFDEELFKEQVSAAVHFWNEYVLKKVMPPISAEDGECILKLYPTHNENYIEIKEKEKMEELETRVAYLKELQNYKKESETEIKQIQNEVMVLIGENLGIKTNKYEITCKLQTRTNADSDKLKADGLFNEYSKVSEFKKLDIKIRKEAA